MKILLVGRDGQLGSTLARTLGRTGASGGDLAPTVITTGRAELDLADPEAIRRVMRATQPDVVLNTAAWTDVDRAETEEAAAHAINAIAPGILAAEAHRAGAFLVHYSTDYVFDGAHGCPWPEDAPTGPRSAYGRTKLEGERRIADATDRFLVLRTAWLYADTGRNFVRTVLRLAAERPVLRIVDDQRGSPTSADVVAAATARILASGDLATGVYHLACSGSATWFEFARAIVDAARIDVAIEPITTAEFGARAPRPACSVLDTTRAARRWGLDFPDWRDALSAWMARNLGGAG